MKTLNTYRKTLSITAAILAVACAPHLAAHAASVCGADPDDMKRWYGIAGGPAGSDAIAHAVKCGKTLRSSAPEEMSKWYGIAGGPIGARAIAADFHGGPIIRAGNEEFGTVYGRAGGLVGAEAIAAITKRFEPRVTVVETGSRAVK